MSRSPAIAATTGPESFLSRVDRFFLYGEPPREAEIDFMHVERIGERSRLHDWIIQPHAHADLHQFLYVLEGGGAIRIEAETRPFGAPALIVMPAGSVHGFAFQPDTDGFVVTAAASLVEEVARGSPPIADLLASWICLDGRAHDFASHDLPGAFEAVAREFVWAAPARLAAISAHLTRILVAGARLALAAGPGAAAGHDREALLVTRFRQLIEQDFRKNLPLGHYATSLGVREARLSVACRRTYGQSALPLVHRRIMVEAQRLLVYTTMSVGEIALSLGFADPAYFSRFFAQRAGASPISFRADRLTYRATRGKPGRG